MLMQNSCANDETTTTAWLEWSKRKIEDMGRTRLEGSRRGVRLHVLVDIDEAAWPAISAEAFGEDGGLFDEELQRCGRGFAERD